MRIGTYRFQPSLIATCVVLIGIIILVRLGSWQLARADEKKTILAEIESRKTSTPLSLKQLDEVSDKNYYSLQLQGRFDNRHYLLLDNRIYQGRPGFEVIQPFISDNRVILVNRGWIPLPLDRNNLPKIPVTDGVIDLIGEVKIPGDAIVLKKDILSAKYSWPQLVQSIDIKALTILFAEIGMKIEPWVLRQKEDEDPFYRRLWLSFSIKPEQHNGYAITWFALAFALIIIYIAAVTTREETTIGTD